MKSAMNICTKRFRRMILLLKIAAIMAIIAVVLSLALIALANYRVKTASKNLLYNEPDKMPYNRTALVLGTTQYLPSGQLNYYFEYRIEAAAALYHAGKVNYLLVSGDNNRHSYNEPQQMRKALIEAGVPDSVIYCDYAGFRTLDSVVRCHRIFQQTKFTIVSQAFHNQRAVYIAQQKGLEVVAYNARDVSARAGLKTRLREHLARVKMLVDLHIISKQPKFDGPPVPIGPPQESKLEL